MASISHLAYQFGLWLHVSWRLWFVAHLFIWGRYGWVPKIIKCDFDMDNLFLMGRFKCPILVEPLLLVKTLPTAWNNTTPSAKSFSKVWPG